jgi:copper chaperone CopZ
MTPRLRCIGTCIAGALFLSSATSPVAAAVKAPPASARIVRVSALLNGVFSPRGFFNILVSLGEVQGVRATKLDLEQSLITIDFDPGQTVTPAQIHQIMINAGYKPGAVAIKQLPLSSASETGPGWRRVKHTNSKDPLIRWVKTNF